MEYKPSSLQLLAQKRAQQRKMQLSLETKKEVSDANKPSLSSLLANLKNNSLQKDKRSLLARTSQSFTPPVSSKATTSSSSSSKPLTSESTLASRLSALRNKKPSVKSMDENMFKKKESPIEFKKPEEDPWQLLHKLRRTQHYILSRISPNTVRLPFTSTIISHDPEKKSGVKRNYYEFSSVYYPNTNHKAVKKQAISNFKKPSPDDIVKEHQKSAFEVAQVEKQINGLALVEETISPDNGTLSDNEDEDGHKPFVEDLVRTYQKLSAPTKPKNPLDLNAFLESRKSHINFVVLGHVDAGKSTLMGRLLYDVGAVDTKLIRKLQKESEMIGKSSFHLAWVMDQTAEERNRGVTVDICTSDFETPECSFTIVDAPGHRDFVPNAIVGISQADIAVLSIDCGTDAFESGFNLDGQTKEHSLLAKSLGIKHIIVAMNKMDTVGWYQGRFSEIKYELTNFFEEIGFKEEDLSWVPCSGLTGEGIHKTEYPIGQTWYRGPSLLGELERVGKLHGSVSHDVIDEGFIFNILDVTASAKNSSVIISGKVEAGCIQPGETITIYPSEQSCVVDSILAGNDSRKADVAVRGDFVQLKLHAAHHEDIQSGDLAAIVGLDIQSAQEFTCLLLTFSLDRPILPGTTLMLFRGCAEQPARIKKLSHLISKSNGHKILKKKVKHIASSQAAIVEVELIDKKRRIPLLTDAMNKKLGRLVFRKEGKTIGTAIVKSLDY